MLTTLAFVLLAAGPAPQATPAAPNVLFIVIDDASWEEFTGLQLPAIQGAAKLGRVYDHFYTSPVCSPSRAQLHFGRYPHDHLIGTALPIQNGEGVPLSDVSLAEALKVEGYSTGMFGKWHVNGSALPMYAGEAARLHGYDTWRAGSINNVMNTGGSHYNWERWDDGQLYVEGIYTTHAIGDELVGWWNQTAGPKFGVCAFLAPHEPFESAPPDLLGGQTFAPTARGCYESALVGIDSKVLQIAASINLANTYVFLFPDNGTPHQVPPPGGLEQGYKLTPFEGGIHVPLIVWGPGVVPGVDSGLVQIVDLPATVLELVGAKMPAEMAKDSISFAKTLDGSDTSKRPWIWSQRFGPNGGPWVGGLKVDEWAVVRPDGWKLLQSQPLGPSTPKLKFLYNIFNDPHETTIILDPVIKSELLLLKKEALGPDWPY